MIIAFIGNDGSGKTTLARTLESKLKKFGLDVWYFQTFDHSVLGYILKIIPSNELNGFRRDFLLREGKKFSLCQIWPYFVFLDCIVTYMKFKLLSRHKIVIFDRYFYDFLMSYEYLDYSNNFIRKLFLHVLPKPDIGFVLDVSPRVAFQRKKSTHNVNIDYYEIQRKRYIKFAHALGIKIVDTERPLKKSTNEVLTEIKTALVSQGYNPI